MVLRTSRGDAAVYPLARGPRFRKPRINLPFTPAIRDLDKAISVPFLASPLASACYAEECSDDGLAVLIRRAQEGDHNSISALLLQFKPLLRSRMHQIWAMVQENLTSLEWDDVESQVRLCFLTRLQNYRPEQGVYFPHYIQRMLDLDGRAWLRSQRVGGAIPFSQLGLGPTDGEDSSDGDDWLQAAEPVDESGDIDRMLGIRAALEALPERQRFVVWECCVLARTEAEVACELGLSRSTVRNRLETALQSMRAFFGETSPVTRTGRSNGKPEAAINHNEFWNSLFTMAKDEKRPDLVGIGAGRPVLLQGVYDFPATGLRAPALLSPKLTYTVPIGSVAGVRFCRIGNNSAGMAYLTTIVNGDTHRIVPVAAHSVQHVAFAIIEALPAGSQIEIHIAAEAAGTAIIDVGCLQMPA